MEAIAPLRSSTIGHLYLYSSVSSFMHQEVFLESSWDDAGTARQQRDCRLAELQSQGLVCTAENLWTVWGDRVYLLVAVSPVEEKEESSRRERSECSRRDASSQRPVRRSPTMPSVEVR